MANPAQQAFEQIAQWWEKLNINQKMIALLTGSAMVLMLGGLIYFGARPDYAVLFTDMSAQDANAVVEHLQEKNVAYRIGAGGNQIEVASDKVYAMRLELAGKGLPRGDGVGFEIFDKMSLGVTDEVQQINYLRAMQNELERTIDSLNAVEKSRVHLVIPKDDLWFGETFTPSASVMLKLGSPGALSPKTVASIRHLLASAVQGLAPERVTIIDTMGKALSSGSESGSGVGISQQQIDYKNKVEKDLKEKAESLLFEILGPGKAAVRIFAEVDFDQIIKEREYYEPVVGGKGLLRSEQQQSISPAGGKATPGGVAGTASNLKGYPPSGRVANSGSKKNESVRNYEMNRTVERITTATGTITRLSVGIFIDGDAESPQLESIQSVISKTLGINPVRGDQIEVKSIAFNRMDVESQKQILEKSDKQQFIMTIATKWVPRALLVLLALGILVTSIRSLNRHTEKLLAGREQEKEKEAQGITPENILSLIKQNPSESGQILKHWLS
ncbi:flagellar M-ring protein FliF [bacterium]|nr:flagellar M-ring protein FliF [bacterium]